MTVFSIILIFSVIYIICTRKKLKDIYLDILCLDIFVSGVINAGYFLKISQYEIDFGYFLDIILLIVSVLMIKSNNIHFKKKLFSNNLLLILVAFLSMFFAIVNTYKGLVVVGTSFWDTYLSSGVGMDYINIDINNWICFFKLLVFSFNIICFYSIVSKEDLNIILTKEFKYFKLLVIICIFEFISKDLLHSNIYDDLKSFVLGTGRHTYTQLASRGEAYMLTGLNKEGSVLVYVLFFAQLLFLIELKKDKKAYFYLIMSILLSIVSMSFTTFLYLGEFVLFVFIYRNNYKGKRENFKILKICFCIFLALFLGVIAINVILSYDFLPSYYQRRLEDAISTFSFIFNSNWKYMNAFHSTQYRLISVFETIKLTFERPIFGFGINTIAVYSSTLKIISSIGYVGLYLWIKLLFHLDKKDKIKFLLIIIWLLFNLVGGFGISEMFSTFGIFIAVLFIFISGYTFNNKNEAKE